MEDRSRLQFSGQIVPSCSKVCFYNKDDESVVFKVNLVGAMRNQVRVTNLLTAFKADLVILEDGSILESDEASFSIDTFNAGASYGVTIVAQKSESSTVLHSSTSHTTEQVPKEIDKCMTQLIKGENGKDGEKVEGISEYEKLRNERVAFNQKRLLELVPGKKDLNFPCLLPVKRVVSIAPTVSSNKSTGAAGTAKVGKNLAVPIASTVNFSHDELYERIFKQRPKGSKRNLHWGRDYLRQNFALQWKVYNQNIKIVRSWFSNVDDPICVSFMQSNLRNQKVIVEDVKDFIRLREPSLASLLFMSNGTVLHVRWQVDDIYEWFKNYKHYCMGRSEIRMVKDVVEESALANDGDAELLEVRGNVGLVETNMHGFNDELDCEQGSNLGMVNQPIEQSSHIQFTKLNSEIDECVLKGKRKRIPSLKAVESNFSERAKNSKQKFKKGKVGELMEFTWLEAETLISQGIQLKTLSENSKKTVAMVLMGLGKIHEVLPNISGFASKTFPQLGIKMKKDDPDQGKTRLKHLDLVVAWALKEFKVGITNPPLLKNGIQQLYLENIKKLS